MAQLNISVPDDVRDWLDANPEVNKSKLFREAVFRKKNVKEGKISSFLFFTSILGWVLAIAVIGISTTPYFVKEIRLSLALLGGVLAVMLGMLCFKEWKRVSVSK